MADEPTDQELLDLLRQRYHYWRRMRWSLLVGGICSTGFAMYILVALSTMYGFDDAGEISYGSDLLGWIFFFPLSVFLLSLGVLSFALTFINWRGI